ncbi:hypothetical protein GGI12_005371 [Dipsacomyces acuminosporus]|nr:hypothetical protein GGI12_005371 [Dipsacomyces acuminosporus]
MISDGDTGTATAIGNNDDDDAGEHVGKTESDRPRKRVRGDGVRIQLPSDDNAEYPFKSSIPRELLMALRDRFKNVSLQSLSWLIRVQDVPANTPTLCRIDPCKPLYTQLQYQTVLEFPTIYVYTAPPPKIGMYNVTIQDKPTAFRTE